MRETETNLGKMKIYLWKIKTNEENINKFEAKSKIHEKLELEARIERCKTYNPTKC